MLQTCGGATSVLHATCLVRATRSYQAILSLFFYQQLAVLTMHEQRKCRKPVWYLIAVLSVTHAKQKLKQYPLLASSFGYDILDQERCGRVQTVR